MPIPLRLAALLSLLLAWLLALGTRAQRALHHTRKRLSKRRGCMPLPLLVPYHPRLPHQRWMRTVRIAAALLLLAGSVVIRGPGVGVSDAWAQTYASQNFDGVTAPTNPAGLTQDTSGSWITSTAHARTSPNAAVNNATDAGAAHSVALSTIAGSADALMEADVYATAGTAVAYVSVRASTAADPLASSYTVEIQYTGGGSPGVRLYRPSGGSLGSSLAAQSGNLVASGAFYRVGIEAQGTTERVYVYRWSDGQYLQSGGTWSGTPAWALTATNSAVSAAGYGAVLVYQPDTARLSFDNLKLSAAVTTPNAGGTSTIAADSTSIHYSPGVVRLPGDGTAILQEQASSARFDFTGDQLGVQVDVSGLQASSLSGTASSWPNLYWSVDGGARQGPVQITAPGSGTVQTISLATGLSTGSTHHAQIWYEEVSGADTYSQSLSVPLTNIVVGAGYTLAAPTGPVADRTGGKAIVWGDSITWGSQAGAIGSNPFYAGYTQALAAGLNLDLGVVGKPGQGITANAAGSPLASGPTLPTSWSKYDSSHARTLPSGLKYAFLAEGTNDASADVTSAVTSLTQAVRTALNASGNSTCRIVWICPPGGSHAAQIAAGVAAASDPLAKVVNSYSAITFPDTTNSASSTADGTHPNAVYHALIGSYTASNIPTLFATGSGTKRKVQ